MTARRRAAARPRCVPVFRAAALAVAIGCAACTAPVGKPASRPGPVFVLGFDGLSPDLVDVYEAQGRLPNFARLRTEGATGRLRSTIPMTSPPAWTTMVTGVPPADHGVWSFWVPVQGNPRGRFVDATCRLAPAVWQDLSAAGRTVGVINVPVTSPPDSVNGFLVAGFPYPAGAPLTWPADLEEEIVRRGYRRDAWLGPPEAGREVEWLDRILAIEMARREIGLELLFDRAPDLSFIVFTAPDRIQHHLWRFHDPKHPGYRTDAPERLRNAVPAIYEWCDDVLGEVLARLPADATLFVVSDHGFGPAYTGVSKARVLERLAGESGAASESRNIFGGDFHLAGADSAARARFAAGLASLTDPEGRAVAAHVHDVRGSPSRGYGLPLGPDVVAEEADGFLFYPGTPDAPLTGPLPAGAFSGWHRREGFFGARGPVIARGPVRTLDLRDLAAMTMHVLGEPIPRRHVHNIPRGLFPPTYFVERPMAFAGGPTDGLVPPRAGAGPDEMDASVAEQLRSVGYLR